MANTPNDANAEPAIDPHQPVPIRTAEDFFAFCDATFKLAVAQGKVPASPDGLTTIYVTAIEECQRRGNTDLVHRILTAMTPEAGGSGLGIPTSKGESA